jgi:hypothetical protein
MRWILAALVSLLIGTAVAVAAPCGGVTGVYSGSAKSSDSTAIEITLNLLCDSGEYRAQFFTSAGDFVGMNAAFTDAHFTAKFDTGAALGTVDLLLKGPELAGEFDLAGDKGTIELVRKGAALAADAMTPRIDLTQAQWHQDLRAFAVELPSHHANAFFSLSRNEFDAEVAKLDASLDTMNNDERLIGMEQIVNSIGDGHTGIMYPGPHKSLPIEITRFGDDFRITAAGDGLTRFLGARIVAIGKTPIEKAYQRALTITPRGELGGLREGRALFVLAHGRTLHGLDITPGADQAAFDLEDTAGKVTTTVFHSVPEGVTLSRGAQTQMLSEQQPDKPFWCESLARNRAVYCAWHSYQDLHANAQKMFALIDSARPRKLIIDMRDNGGGDNTVGYAELVKPIETRADLNARGRLYVLIGPLTFSAAMNNAAQFQDETAAILAGQTIGERPNSYQEPRQFRLPNSHLVVRASTLWYAFRKKGPNVVAPDREIIPTWDDVKSGRDPVMDWVLASS